MFRILNTRLYVCMYVCLYVSIYLSNQLSSYLSIYLVFQLSISVPVSNLEHEADSVEEHPVVEDLLALHDVEVVDPDGHLLAQVLRPRDGGQVTFPGRLTEKVKIIFQVARSPFQVGKG